MEDPKKAPSRRSGLFIFQLTSLPPGRRIRPSLPQMRFGFGSIGCTSHHHFVAARFSMTRSFSSSIPTAPIYEIDATSGSVVEEYLSDNFKATSWLTLTAGLRQSRFQPSSEPAQFTEDAAAPRLGAALRIPKLDWVFRGFYGRFYQPPPLITASGPVLAFANANNTTLVPLHGERDEEHQFGVQIPFRGWLLDADTFKNRVNNFLDHSNIGDSSVYFPVTVDGALIRAWELTLRSPRLWHFGQAHLAYRSEGHT